MADLLLELLCEEIPARMQARACEDLQKMLHEAFAAEALSFETMAAYATPRRLVVHVTGLPLAQSDVSEELKGPRTDAPEQALAGFLKKTGLTKEQLDIRDDGKKGQTYFANLSRQGRETAAVIAGIIPGIVQKFPWPKSMRWGGASLSTDSLRWVRPLQSIICLLNNNVVPFEIDGIKSGNVTRGHRFMSMSQFTVDSFDDYRTKLRMSKVILDPAERMKKIDADARALAAGVGLTLVEDAGLLAENAGLTEWPVVLMGEFDASYLDVPAECLTATMRANQKYFSLRDADGKLANRFLCTANLEAKDGGKMIVAGNQKVLSARLSDAKFFWDQDRKKKLEEYLPKLGDIVFHEKLGTVADKVARVEKLAEHLARTLHPQFYGVTPAQAAPSLVTPAQAGVHASTGAPLAGMDTGLRRYDDVESFVKDVRRAAKLCKADLVTGMVGEFPELQGIMGRYYATAQGENPDVALAIEEHYKPQGLNDTVPANPVSVVLALADKIDTLVGFFAIDEKPTGSRDPFALRRAALGVVRLLIEGKIEIQLKNVFQVSWDAYLHAFKNEAAVFYISYNPRASKGELHFPWLRDEIMNDMRHNDIRDVHDNPLVDGFAFSLNREVIKAFSSFNPPYDNPDNLIDLANSKGYFHFDTMEDTSKDLLEFLLDRYSNFVSSEFTNRSVIVAARAGTVKPDDLRNIHLRALALAKFLNTDAGAGLMTGYVRVKGIVDQATGPAIAQDDQGMFTSDPAALELFIGLIEGPGPDANKFLTSQESDLNHAVNNTEATLKSGKIFGFEQSLLALSNLRLPIDNFFKNVLVNSEEENVRKTRYALLSKVLRVMESVADFSLIKE